MMLFNRISATIISLLLIVSAAISIVFLLGLISGSGVMTRPVAEAINAVAGLPAGQIQAILIAAFIVSFILFVFEIRPRRVRPIQAIAISESENGDTKVIKADVEAYLTDRVVRENRTFTPTRMDLNMLDDYKFNVNTSVAVSTVADKNNVKARVDKTIKKNLAAIGLERDLIQVNSRVERVKRVA
jgi:hypothetical protein